MTAIPLIIDTDPGLGVAFDGRPRDVDDAFAIVEAIRRPEFELLGLTVTHGNVPLADGVRVARDLVRLAAVDVPVLAGAATALPQNPESAPEPASAAVEFLRDTLRRSDGVRIAAIGPLTNLGALLLHHPNLAARIEEVVIVAGRTRGERFYLGDVGPVRDFNFENDVRAARILLESGVPIVMAGFEVSSRIVVTAADLETLRTRATPLADRLHRDTLPWLDFWTKTFPADAGFHPWDSAAIGWLRQPQLFTVEARGWRIRDESLTSAERAHNPDGSPATVPWLETGRDLPGPRVTYCTGLREGAAAEFVRASLAELF